MHRPWAPVPFKNASAVARMLVQRSALHSGGTSVRSERSGIQPASERSTSWRQLVSPKMESGSTWKHRD